MVFSIGHNVYASEGYTDWQSAEEAYITLYDGTQWRIGNSFTPTLDEAHEMGIDIWDIFERQFGVSNIDEFNEELNALAEERRQSEWEAHQLRHRRQRLVRGIGTVLLVPIAYFSHALHKRRN